jgi:hypothetical protein
MKAEKRGSPIMRCKNGVGGRILARFLLVAMLAGAPLTEALAQFPAEPIPADPGQSLTPFGAERAGNKEGTIPAWTGGITEPPAGYTVGMHHPDPFPDDRPLFTITVENMAQYTDKLTAGHQALLKQYPQSYRLPVYPTRRSASAPAGIYEETKANATRARLAPGGNGVIGAKGGVPFPLPGNGNEVIWNHMLRWRGQGVTRRIGQVNPQVDGSYTLITIEEKAAFLYNRPSGPADTVSYYFRQEVIGPARLAGEIVLVHESLNPEIQPRVAWTYNPGQRRVRRAPNIGFDSPGTASDGMRTADQTDMFNGSLERYDFSLVGKREVFVPYNAYRLHSRDLACEDIIRAHHINQDLTRYELHRVWVVEAVLKPGISHIYKRRTFYVDEDSWQILTADQYDGQDRLWRVSEAHPINYYEVPAFLTTLEIIYDLQSGRYTALGLDNQERMYDFSVSLTAADFSPDGLRQSGVR